MDLGQLISNMNQSVPLIEKKKCIQMLDDIYQSMSEITEQSNAKQMVEIYLKIDELQNLIDDL